MQIAESFINVTESEEKIGCFPFPGTNTKHLNLVEQINRKNLKIPVFGGLRVNLVVFEFVPMIPQENLVKFDL